MRAHRWTLLAAALTLTLPGLLAPPAQAAVPAPTSSPAEPMVQETFRLSGPIGTAFKRPVWLQRYDGGWATLIKGTATATGNYYFNTRASASFLYRAIAPPYVRNGVTHARVITPKRRVTPVAQTAAGVLTTPTTLRAGFRPIRVGRSVVLQVQQGSGWQNAGPTGVQDANGRVVFSLEEPESGTWRYRAVARTYRGAPPKATGAVNVTAPEPSDESPIELVSGSVEEPADGVSTLPTVSHDGRYVAFRSIASNLVPGDTNGQADVFLKDRETGVVTLISEGTGGNPADNFSADPVVAGSGNCVVFESRASNLVAGDTNDATDLFIWRRASGSITRINTTPDGGQSVGGTIGGTDVTPDCEFVVYDSRASDLDEDDNNIRTDVFRWTQPDTTVPGINRRISRALESGGNEQVSDGESESPTINDDGNLIAFHSSAGNLVAGDEYDALQGRDVFVWDQATQTLDRITEGNDDHSGAPDFNGTGTRIAYATAATNALGIGGAPLPGGHSQVIVEDLQTGAIMLASRTVTGGHSEESATLPKLSSSGTHVVFGSRATDLASPVEEAADTDHDVFLRDLLASTTERISLDINGNDSAEDSYNPEISGDGDHVVFSSQSPFLTVADSNSLEDVFIWQRPAG